MDGTLERSHRVRGACCRYVARGSAACRKSENMTRSSQAQPMKPRVSAPAKRRGVIVWCLILFGLGEFLNSLWEVAFARHLPRSASPTLAHALTEAPAWLWVPETVVGGMLGLLMAWQFFNMSAKVLWVLYATLLWCVVVMVANLLVNPAGRAVVASFGLLP